MEIEYGVGLHNKFDIQLVDSTGNIKQEITAYNIVLNSYYSHLSNDEVISFNRLLIGTGTGTPAVTDTGLFQLLAYKDFDFAYTDVIYHDVNQYSVAASLTFTENEAIGRITEIGISNRNNTLYTHAMVSDAEGHTISINKTNTDRLIITITVYLTLVRPDNVVPYHGVSVDCYSVYGEQATSGSTTLERIVSTCLGLSTNIVDGNCAVYYCASPGCPATNWIPDYVGYKSVATMLDVAVTSGIIRMYSRDRILSTDGNLPGTYQIYGMCTQIGYIPITSDIFPPLHLTLTKVGDGVQTAFNFGISELTSNVKVYINDVLQDVSSYTWNGKDYSLFQTWETARADKVIKSPSCTAHGGWYNCYCTPIFNYQPLFGQSPTINNYDIVYDFGEIKQFNKAYKPEASTEYRNWEYSNDGSSWTTIVIPASPTGNYYTFPTPISARYLRMQTGLIEGTWINYWTPPLPELCCYSDQLVFNTAPPVDSVIKVEIESLYPIKNANWIIDQFVLDLKIGRA